MKDALNPLPRHLAAIFVLVGQGVLEIAHLRPWGGTFSYDGFRAHLIKGRQRHALLSHVCMRDAGAGWVNWGG